MYHRQLMEATKESLMKIRQLVGQYFTFIRQVNF
jgi:hypothetical protein